MCVNTHRFVTSEPLDVQEDGRTQNPDQRRHQTVISITPKEWKVRFFKLSVFEIFQLYRNKSSLADKNLQNDVG